MLVEEKGKRGDVVRFFSFFLGGRNDRNGSGVSGFGDDFARGAVGRRKWEKTRSAAKWKAAKLLKYKCAYLPAPLRM